MTCINAWLPELWKKGRLITNFVTGQIATDNMKEDIIDLKERGKMLEINSGENLQRRTQN